MMAISVNVDSPEKIELARELIRRGADVGINPSLAQNEHWVACRNLLVAVRAAGGTWIAYRKVQRKSVLRMRSLIVRGRARPRRTSDADPLIAPIFRLPNELCWHVLQFWRATCDATGEVI